MARADKKGKPSAEGKSKGEVKTTGARKVLDLEREEVYRERYTDEEDEPGSNVKQNNPNRNRNKGEGD